LIACPNCQHQNITGTLFCSQCGAQLIKKDAISNPQTIPAADFAYQRLITNRLTSTPDEPIVGSKAALHIMDTGKIVPLTGRDEFTLGRTVEGQPITPDIDLSPYKAYEKGVSRLHAKIKINGSIITVIDLGSVNGTRVNGQKIAPDQPYPLNHGDILSLSKFKIQLLNRKG
jgi:hypothetical protein